MRWSVEFLANTFLVVVILAIVPFYLAWLGLGWCADRLEGKANG